MARVRGKPYNTWGDVQPARKCSRTVVDPWLRLGGGILLQAVEEGRGGDLSALDWLQNDVVAELIAGELGFDFTAVKRKAARWERSARAARKQDIIIRVFVPVSQPGGSLVYG